MRAVIATIWWRQNAPNSNLLRMTWCQTCQKRRFSNSGGNFVTIYLGMAADRQAINFRHENMVHLQQKVPLEQVDLGWSPLSYSWLKMRVFSQWKTIKKIEKVRRISFKFFLLLDSRPGYVVSENQVRRVSRVDKIQKEAHMHFSRMRFWPEILTSIFSAQGEPGRLKFCMPIC
jgi:hypothetical protein